MQRVNLICAKDSNQPATDNAQLRAALERRKSLIDFRLADIADAKRALGMDSVHAQKLDGLVDGWREVESADDRGAGGARTPARRRRRRRARRATRPTGNGENQNNCDQLAPVADQMIGLIKLAFEWDLTRVVALHPVGRVERPALAEPGASTRPTTRWSTATTSPA